MIRWFLLLSVVYNEMVFAECKDLQVDQRRQLLLSKLLEQEGRTDWWNWGFSWGNMAFGAFELWNSRSASSDTAGDVPHEKGELVVAGVRSLLSGAFTLYKPLSWDDGYRKQL